MRKKLLFLTSQLPELSSGSQVRSYYFLQHLKKYYDVTLCCVTDQHVNEKEFKENIFSNTYIYSVKNFSLIKRLFCFLKGKIPYVERYRQSVPEKDLKKMLKNTDICFFSELNGYFIADKYVDLIKGKKIFDAHNVEYIKLSGEVFSKNYIYKLLGDLVVNLMRIEEQRALAQMSVTYVCSKQDQKQLTKLVPQAPIQIIPNGVDCKRFVPNNKKPVSNSLLFMGSLGYPPNNDGLKYFLDKIYPLVKRTYKDISFTIIGKGASRWLGEYARKDSSVKLIGFVEDVRPHIASAAVCICPLRFGSGTRLKILEYMAMGKPVVSTTVGAEGIEITDKEDLLLARTPKEFAQGIVSILENPKLATKLAGNARACVEKKYDWNVILSNL